MAYRISIILWEFQNRLLVKYPIESPSRTTGGHDELPSQRMHDRSKVPSIWIVGSLQNVTSSKLLLLGLWNILDRESFTMGVKVYLHKLCQLKKPCQLLMQSWVGKKLTGLYSIGPINPYPLTLDQYTNCHWSKWSMVNQFQIPTISLVNRVHVTHSSYGQTNLQSLGFYKNNMITCILYIYIIQVSNILEWIYIFGESPILVWPIPRPTLRWEKFCLLATQGTRLCQSIASTKV